MTEAEWLTCVNPEDMLGFLRGRVSIRKQRLFAVACCRRVWHLMPDERSRRAIEVAENLAEGTATSEEVAEAREDVSNACDEARHAEYVGEAEANFCYTAKYCTLMAKSAASFAARSAVGDGILMHNVDNRDEQWRQFESHRSAASAAYHDRQSACYAALDSEEPTILFSASVAGEEAGTQEMKDQADTLRCIVGNPFRHVSLNPAWLRWNDGTGTKIAQAIYAERRFEDLPILADALEDAGCDNADILAHCRSGGPHVRGCWAVDLLLGKE